MRLKKKSKVTTLELSSGRIMTFGHSLELKRKVRTPLDIIKVFVRD